MDEFSKPRNFIHKKFLEDPAYGISLIPRGRSWGCQQNAGPERRVVTRKPVAQRAPQGLSGTRLSGTPVTAPGPQSKIKTHLVPGEETKGQVNALQAGES